ncbi:MAG: glycoside hydrolase [Myxococcota bacterium]|nr:glycoside hydrolase [Myxococcota bacterium]
MRQLLVVLSVVGGLGGLAGDALANGRAPQTSTINFRKGMETEIAAGMTFGLLISKDNGATWRWICEDALPYGGMYDPDYIYTSTGTLLATTFDGLKINRDGCTFSSTVLSPPPPALKFFSVIAQGSDDAIYAAAADPLDFKVYKSTDDGATFPTSSAPGQLNDWYQSLEVAPSDPARLYLTGYRFVDDPEGGSAKVKVHLLSRSVNGGSTWQTLPVTAFTTMSNSTIEIAGVSPTNPNLVFARVKLEDNAIRDAIYRSTDGGLTWTRVLGTQGAIAFLVRASGELVAGTQNQGSFRSVDNGATWTELTTAPHINCLVENAAGEVWACTQNYGVPTIPKDGFGIMKSSDLVTWTGLLDFRAIEEPVACGSETLQYQKCDRNPNIDIWCGLCAQLGCDAKRECEVTNGDGSPDAGTTGPGEKPGCCETGDGGAPGALALGLVVGMVLIRSRRRHR